MKEVPANSLHHHNETRGNGDILKCNNVLRDHKWCLGCKAHAYTTNNLVPNPPPSRGIDLEGGQKACDYGSEDEGCGHERPDVAGGCDAKAARDGCYRLRNSQAEACSLWPRLDHCLCKPGNSLLRNTRSASGRKISKFMELRGSRASDSGKVFGKTHIGM